jgi:NOL1/NOP2/fmu family ribosome biogenesis protein
MPVHTAWGVVETISPTKQAWGYRFYPDKLKGEGLFAACLQKNETARAVNPAKRENVKLPAKELDLVQGYLKDAGDFHYFKANGVWMAIQREHQSSLELLQKYLYLKKSGTRIGQVIGHDLVPEHELALSIHLNKDAILQTPLGLEQAIQYLRRDPLDLNSPQKGWSMMTFENHALGWAKVLHNRVNNYYPKEMRILRAQALVG